MLADEMRCGEVGDGYCVGDGGKMDWGRENLAYPQNLFCASIDTTF
jgi:hypothetical protein